MKKTIRLVSIFSTGIAAAAILLCMAIISCNKSSTPGSTTFKCVSCGIGGACINDTCRCYAGFEGTDCATETRTKFLNAWQVTEKGSLSDTVHYTVEVNQDTGFTHVLLRNFFGGVASLTVTGYVSGDSLIIPKQYNNSKMTIGVGHIDPTHFMITMKYAVTDTTSGIVVDFGYYSAADSPSVWALPVML